MLLQKSHLFCDRISVSLLPEVQHIFFVQLLVCVLQTTSSPVERNGHASLALVSDVAAAFEALFVM